MDTVELKNHARAIQDFCELHPCCSNGKEDCPLLSEHGVCKITGQPYKWNIDE